MSFIFFCLLIYKIPTNRLSWVNSVHYSPVKILKNISLSDSTKTQCFQCPLCVDVKSVNKTTIGNDLLLDNYVNTAITNVRVLKRVPKYSGVPLAERLSDKINGIVYNVEDVTKWLIFLTSFLFFFFGATEKKWTQTDHKHELFDI